MKKQLFIITLLCLWVSLTHAQSWLWAKSAHGAFDDWGQSIVVDAQGNTYVAGRFTSTSISFGSTTLKNSDSTNTSNPVTGMSMDVFLAKYDANGNVLWTKSARGTDNMDEGVFSVAVDALGNAYMAGMFSSSTLSFDSITLTNAGVENIFLAKYDTDGNVLWAKSAGGSFHDWGYAVAVSTLGNVYLTGVFQSPTITFGSTTLTNTDNTGQTTDLFLAKYDASGNVVWAKSAGGITYDWALAVAVDKNEKVSVTGYFFSPTLTFESTMLTNTNELSDIFLAQYDADGNTLWSKSVVGAGADDANAIAIDASGNIFVIGDFDGTLIFDNITLTRTGSANSDIFLAKYSSDGDILWAKNSSGLISYIPTNDFGSSVAVDASGNVYIAGRFESPTFTLDTISLTNAGEADIYLAKYNSNGNVLWAKSQGGTNNDGALSVAVDNFGNAFITGWFREVCSFGSTSLSNVDPVFGGSDLFIAKIGVTTGINEINNTLNTMIFPNPSNGKFIISCNRNIYTIEIFNIIGEKVFHSEINNQKSEIDLSLQPKGIYFVKISDGENIYTEKIIIQ